MACRWVTRWTLLALAAALDAPRPTLWVCGNQWCRRRGAAVPLGAPLAIAPGVDVRPRGCFGRCGEGPNVAAVVDGTTVEWHAVDSVEKVKRILERYLGARVDADAARCLELHVLAEAARRRRDPELAARLYSDALATGHAAQRGPVLAGRAAARLGLARDRRRRVAGRLEKTGGATDTDTARRVLLEALGARDSFSKPIFSALLADAAGKLAPPADAFDAAMSEFLARAALDDAAGAVAALPAYARGWRLLVKILRFLGRDVEAELYSAVADRLDEPASAAVDSGWAAAWERLRRAPAGGGLAAA